MAPCRAATLALKQIVDRIGGGDAYAAGVIYGLSQHIDRARIVDFAVTLAALKHGTPGDFVVAPGGRLERTRPRRA